MSDLEEGSLTGEQPVVPDAIVGAQPDTTSWEDPLPTNAPPVQNTPQQKQSLPSWDEAKTSSVPTWDEAMTQNKPSLVGNVAHDFATTVKAGTARLAESLSFGGYDSSPAVNEFLKTTPLGNIMQSFGYGFGEQTDSYKNLGIEPGGEVEKSLQQAGLLKDLTKNDGSIVKSLTDGIVRSSAAALDAGMRTLGGIPSGLGSALKQAGGPLTGVGEIVSAVPEGFGTEFAGGHTPSFTKEDLTSSKAAGVLDGEDVYMGLKEPTPEQAQAQNVAAVQVAPTKEVKAAEPQDIHTAARQIAPETFGQWDRLNVQADTIRTQLSNLSDDRTKAIDEQIQAIKDAKQGGYGKIQSLEAKRQDLIEGGDTPEMAELREQLQKIDYQRRDLSPDIAAAYRKAQEQMPQVETVTNKPVQAAPLLAPSEPSAAPKIDIAADASKNLQSAGRPAEEADAAAQLVKSHYEARAQRFGGQLGTAEDMYGRDMANIKAGREVGVREKELAQDNNAGEALQKKITDDYEGAKNEYAANPDTQGGKVLNTDSARELSPEYLADRSRSHDVHEPASSFIKKLYAEKLKESPKEGEEPTVLFTAGGTGSGKSTAVKNALGDVVNESQIVYDTNMNTLSSSVKKVEQALSAGKKVEIVYVYRDPVDALINGALARATKQEKKFGTGRTVPLNEHIKTHVGSLKVVKQLQDKYKDNPRVNIQIVDNSGARNGAKTVSIDKIPEIAQDGLKKKLEQALEEQRQKGTISERTYQGFLQDSGRPNEEDQLGSTASGQSEPQRGSRSSDELNQSARGKIRLATEDAKATITLFKSANASTFIHEIGHHWVQELLDDADRSEAPADLSKDAKTIRDYVGSDGGDLTRQQHEKLARGFERYVMEGTSPSKELAGVFAKFKQWLTQIYQTVQKLRSPISDDIRDVFDRLLSNNPERTIITPEADVSKHMADIHVQDAIETPPEKAAEVADNIRNEVKTVAASDKETLDAINAAEKNAGGSGDTAVSEPTTTNATSPEPSEINAGGVAAAPNSDAERAGEGTGKPSIAEPSKSTTIESGTKPADPESGKPNSPIGRQESNLVDKAGNIRLDNLNTPEDVNKVLRDAASQNSDFMEARRGIIPVGDQLNLADALGMQPQDLNFRKIGEAFNAEQILAARKLLVQSAFKVRELMNGTDVAAYAEAKARHLMIQEQVAGITAEAGRALGAFRKLEGSEDAKALGDFLKNTTGKDLFQLQQEMDFGKNLQTPQQVSMFINATKKATFRDMLLEYYINSLISGPITHLRYSVGNAINALATPLLEIPFAAASGAIREALGAEVADRVYLGEAKAQLQAIFKGSREGLYAASTAFKTGRSPLLPQEHVPDNFLDFKVNAIPGALGQAINVPGKSVSAIHSFFKSLRYEQNINGLAYRTAMKEGLEGEEFNNRVADLSVNPTEDMMKDATKNALKELYMAPTEYNSTMGALNRAVNSNLAAKIIVPFMKIGSQITRNAFIERTPLGLLDKEVRGNLFGDNGAAKDTQLGKMAVGTALMGTMSLMTLEGMATGDGPTDPSKRAVWLLTHKPNSIKIGDITIPYQGLGSYGMLMRFASNMTETAQGWDASDGDKLAKSFFGLMEGVNKSVLDENFMRGIKDMLDAMYHPEEYGTQYIKNFALNWLPYSVGLSQVAHEVDPDMRESKSIFDAARAKIPFVSQELEPKRDVFGQPIPTSGSLQNYENDATAKRMDALQMGIGKLNRKILGVPLTDQQYDDFSRIAGKTTKMRLDALIQNPGFQNLPPHIQIDTIHKIVTDSRKIASSIIMMQNPEIMRQAQQNKMSALKGNKPQ